MDRQPGAKPTLQSLSVGERGPVLLQDTNLHETLREFVYGRPMERAVYAKGFGALGSFTTQRPMGEYTRAGLFRQPGVQVPVLSRFSLAIGGRDTPDTGRNIRGFATRFYTGEGNFDLLCNHLPVFSVRDAIRFPEFIRASLPSPVSNLPDPNRFWGFVARAPEALHFVTWLYSDAGTVKSLRKIRTYGVNTYIWRNAEDRVRYVKYHWLPLAGEECIDAQQAVLLAGQDPNICGRDLYDTIASGKAVEYDLCVQMMNPSDAQSLPFDPLDCTKIWDEAQFPLMPVGRLSLNRNPEDFGEQIEKAAFSPANLIEGIELSDDKMLQGRATVYWDAQRRRLGPEFRNISVNRQPNWTPDRLVTSGKGQFVDGYEMRAGLDRADDFLQAGERYRALPGEMRGRLVENIAFALREVRQDIAQAVLRHLQRADEEFADYVYEQMRR